MGQPGLHQPLRADRVLFYVVKDEVAVRAKEMGATPVIGQYVTVEQFDLQAEIDQRMLHT